MESAAVKSKLLALKGGKKESTSELDYYRTVPFASCQTVRP